VIYIEATKWENGELIACWTSEHPGRTGPVKPWWQWLRMTRKGWRVRLRRSGG
jgi:hypothetical protein